MSITAAFADRTIKPADGNYKLVKPNYNTQDIIELVLQGDKVIKGETEGFSHRIAPTRAGMRELHDFLRFHIRYQKDPKGAQWVKTPARLWQDRKGDCKSYTLFITSVLQNLGLDYYIDFVSYRKNRKRPHHVYPVVILPDGEEVVMDVVYSCFGGGFNREKRFYHKTRYKVKKGLAFLSGPAKEEKVLDAILEIHRMIPDAIMATDDVTQMTEGELQRYLMAQRLEIGANQAESRSDVIKFRTAAQVVREADMAGVGYLERDLQDPVTKFIRETDRLTAPAMRAPVLRFRTDQDIAGLFDFLKKVGKKVVGGVKDAAQKVGEAFKAAFAKLMNWIFKIGLPKAAPFFLFTFIKKGKLPAKVAKRKMKQEAIIGWIKKTADLKDSNIRATLKNGIIKKLGAAPEKILNDYAKHEIANPAAVAAVINVIGMVVQLIKKIADLFKKDKPDVGKEDGSDLTMLEEIPELESGPSTTGGYTSSTYNKGGYSPSGGGGGNTGTIAIAIAALLGLAIVPRMQN